MKSRNTEAKVHLLYLDSLRGIAAMLVVVHHAFLQVDLTGYNLTTGQDYLLRPFRNGHYPVNFFIVLSGYCLMLPVIRANYSLPGGTLLFFRKRAKRILPPYYIAMLLSLALALTLIAKKTGTHWDISVPVTTESVITHLLLVQDVFAESGAKINHALWSISVEWRIYFLFPVLLLLWRKIGALPTLILSALTSLILVGTLRYLHISFPFLNNTPNGIVPHYLLLFVLGMFGANIAFSQNTLFSRWGPAHWTASVVLMTLLIVLVLAVQERYIHNFPWQAVDVLVGVWGMCLLVLCNVIQHSSDGSYQLSKAIMSWRPLVFTGTIGYSLYLIHAPLLQLISQYVLAPLALNPFATFLILGSAGLLGIIGISYLFFLLFEKPFMNKRAPSVAVAAIIEPAI